MDLGGVVGSLRPLQVSKCRRWRSGVLHKSKDKLKTVKVSQFFFLLGGLTDVVALKVMEELVDAVVQKTIQKQVKLMEADLDESFDQLANDLRKLVRESYGETCRRWQRRPPLRGSVATMAPQPRPTSAPATATTPVPATMTATTPAPATMTATTPAPATMMATTPVPATMMATTPVPAMAAWR
jgi:hypothetical protein